MIKKYLTITSAQIVVANDFVTSSVIVSSANVSVWGSTRFKIFLAFDGAI